MESKVTPPVDREISNLASFFGRLREATSQSHLQRGDEFGEFVEGWPRFVDQFQSVLMQAAQVERRTASNYNIFRLLRIEHDEEKTHSRMLSDLLDPHGSHGQGELFLRLFLDHCHQKRGRQPLPDAAYASQWVVETEKGIPTGRLDIVIRCPAIDFVVVIENKIFAPEQSDQLGRYARWVRSQHRDPNKRMLIFLTPDGQSPATGSDEDWLCLSYTHDIAGVIKRVLQDHIEPSNLSFTLRQYLAVITNLVAENERGELPE